MADSVWNDLVANKPEWIPQINPNNAAIMKLCKSASLFIQTLSVVTHTHTPGLLFHPLFVGEQLATKVAIKCPRFSTCTCALAHFLEVNLKNFGSSGIPI